MAELLRAPLDDIFRGPTRALHQARGEATPEAPPNGRSPAVPVVHVATRVPVDVEGVCPALDHASVLP